MDNNKPTFKHGFSTAFGIVDINGAQNYMKALNAVSQHIIDKAIQKDNALYVNASELMEVIKNTGDELSKLVNEELKGDFHPDNLMNTIVGIVKKDAKDRYGIDLDKKTEIEYADEYYLQAKDFVRTYPNKFTKDIRFWENAIANEIRKTAIKTEKETIQLLTNKN